MGHFGKRVDRVVSSETSILEALFEYGHLTKAELGAVTGLSRPTIVDAVSRLSTEGVVTANKASHGGIGRHPDAVSIINTRALNFVADVGGSKVVAGLVGLDGSVFVERVEATAGDAKAVALQLRNLKDELSRIANVSSETISGAVIGLPGVLEEDGRIMHGDNIAGLDECNTPALLSEYLECVVQIENDVNLAGMGEISTIEITNSASFAFVSVGTGLGMALVLNGRIVRGATGRAGEIGFLPLFGDPMNIHIRKQGSAELSVSGPALETLYSQKQSRISASEIVNRAHNGEANASLVIQEFSLNLARVIYSVAAVVNPHYIVLGGGLGSNPLLLPFVRDALIRIAPFQIEVHSSSLSNRAGLIGAAVFARENLREELCSQYNRTTQQQKILADTTAWQRRKNG